MGRKERVAEAEEKRKSRKELKEDMLDNDDSFLETKIYYKQMKTGLTDDDGRLVVTGLAKNRRYKIFDVFGLKELAELIKAGMIDAKDLR